MMGISYNIDIELSDFSLGVFIVFILCSKKTMWCEVYD